MVALQGCFINLLIYVMMTARVEEARGSWGTSLKRLLSLKDVVDLKAALQATADSAKVTLKTEVNLASCVHIVENSIKNLRQRGWEASAYFDLYS
ncbi:hypothetical protein HDU67_007901, partial [Dinochytrium kinnereticum]